MSRMFTTARLCRENQAFAGTGGVSSHNHHAGFSPAFRDPADGRVEIARFDNGDPAPMHLFCGLPQEWVVDRDENGQVTAIRDSIVAGFVRDAIFYTRDEAGAMV